MKTKNKKETVSILAIDNNHHYLPFSFHRNNEIKPSIKENHFDRLKNILGINPKDNIVNSRIINKEKSFSAGKTNTTRNIQYINKSAFLVADSNKNEPIDFKIRFIKKNYGNLKPFKEVSEKEKIKEQTFTKNTSNQKKLPTIAQNPIALINSKNENQTLYPEKINKKKQEILINEKINHGKQKLLDNDFESAIRIFEEIIQINPLNIESHYYLGFAYLHKTNYKKAIEKLEIVISNDIIYSKSAYILEAVCYNKMGNLTRCFEILDNSLEKNSKFYDALIYRGKIYLKTKQYEKALQDFTEALKFRSTKLVPFASLPAKKHLFSHLFGKLNILSK